MDKILDKQVSNDDRELLEENNMMLENIVRQAIDTEQSSEYFTVEPEEIAASLRAALI